jgi:hypothetical protein
MSEAAAIIGVWCAEGSKLLAPVYESMETLRLTMRRCALTALPVRALIPWDPALDHMEQEVKAMGFWRVRCHLDERIAMRDLVAEERYDIGILVPGEAAHIDSAEIMLAIARIQHGVGGVYKYTSPRLKAYKAEHWLTISDTDEWPPEMDQKGLERLYARGELNAEARMLWARQRLPLQAQ